MTEFVVEMRREFKCYVYRRVWLVIAGSRPEAIDLAKRSMADRPAYKLFACERLMPVVEAGISKPTL